jgi:acetyl-CoA decarbonylase/synthase complex subunit gamma
MQLAQKKVSLDKCPHVTEKVKDMLQSASEPPVRLITVGSGDKKIAVGNETVLFRHEEKFHHQTAIGFSLSQDMSADEIRSASPG